MTEVYGLTLIIKCLEKGQPGKNGGIMMPQIRLFAVFYRPNGNQDIIRPSGTEPKIKFYIGVKGEMKTIGDYVTVNDALDNKNLKKSFRISG